MCFCAWSYFVRVFVFVFFLCVCFAATQLAHQLHQERTHVVCSNKEARKRLARRHRFLCLLILFLKSSLHGGFISTAALRAPDFAESTTIGWSKNFVRSVYWDPEHAPSVITDTNMELLDKSGKEARKSTVVRVLKYRNRLLSSSPEGLSALSEGLDLKLTEGLHASRQRFENEIRSPSATRHKPAKLRLKSISSAKSARMQSLCMWESPQITHKRPVSYQRYASSPTRYVESSNVDTQQGPDVETHRQRLSLMIDYFTSALGITAQSWFSFDWCSMRCSTEFWNTNLQICGKLKLACFVDASISICASISRCIFILTHSSELLQVCKCSAVLSRCWLYLETSKVCICLTWLLIFEINCVFIFPELPCLLRRSFSLLEFSSDL